MRKRLKGKPNPDVYALRVQCLREFEQQSEQGTIDLYYADESRVSLTPCIPYAWQFADEQAFMPCDRGEGLNCFALLRRDNQCIVRTTSQAVTAGFIVEQLEGLSFSLERLTVVVLDNAPIHHAKQVKARHAIWQERGLFVVWLWIL